MSVERREERGCPVKGCPWKGEPEHCPFGHADPDPGNTFLDRLMRTGPDGQRRHRRR